MNRRSLLKAGVAALAFAGAIVAQQSGRALLADSTDIGVTKPGSTGYSSQTGVYVLTGGGADMWGAADAFRFAWTKISGDAAIAADVHFVASTQLLDHVPGARGAGPIPADLQTPASPQPLAKAVLVFRQSLEPGSPYADIAIHADGHITLQYRTVAGGRTADVTAVEHGSTRLRIERAGNQFTASSGSADGKLTPFSTLPVPMDDPVYVGIGVCAHDAAGLITVNFSNVAIEHPPHSPTPAKK
jgi:hypothetical protein